MATDRVGAVSDLLENVAGAAGPFQLKAGGLGVFPTVKRPRVLWMGITGDTAPLIAFARNLDARLAGLGFAEETRPFRAHLTLGRFKAKTDARRLTQILLDAAEIEPAAFSADQVILFKSDLKPSGAVHTPLAAIPLTDGDK